MRYSYYHIQKIARDLLNNPSEKTLSDASRIILELYNSQYQNSKGDK